MAIFKRSHCFQTIVLGIHVSFRGCTEIDSPDFPYIYIYIRIEKRRRFCHPSEQTPKFKTPHIPEDGGGIRRGNKKIVVWRCYV